MREIMLQLRRGTGLTQYEVARMLGISRSFYSQIENGDRNPTLNLALRIKILLKHTGDDIFTVTSRRNRKGHPFTRNNSSKERPA